MSSCPKNTTYTATEHSILVPRTVHGITYNYILYFKIVHPNFLSSKTHLPLVVIHGGLGLPSDYLQPMATQIQEDRTVIFYDMLGCGRSESPPLLEYYSILDAVHDLHLLMRHLNLTHFHMYAHSAGVVIAYEYLKLYNHNDNNNNICNNNNNNNICNKYNTNHNTYTASQQGTTTCLSAIFASGSFHMGLAKQCTDAVQQKIQRDLEEADNDHGHDHDHVSSSSLSSSENVYHFPWNTTSDAHTRSLTEQIRTSVICRTDSMPSALKSAYEKSGTVWKGISVIQDYVATCPEDASCIPPLLLLRGEFDFISQDLVFAGWLNVLEECEQQIEMITVRNCSHMLMLEDPILHGQIIRDFYNKHDRVTNT